MSPPRSFSKGSRQRRSGWTRAAIRPAKRKRREKTAAWTGKLPINLPRSAAAAHRRGRARRVQGRLESGRRAAHHLRFRQRLSQSRRWLCGGGCRGARRAAAVAAQGHRCQAGRRGAERVAAFGPIRPTSSLPSAYGGIRCRGPNRPRAVGARRRNTPVRGQSRSGEGREGVGLLHSPAQQHRPGTRRRRTRTDVPGRHGAPSTTAIIRPPHWKTCPFG